MTPRDHYRAPASIDREDRLRRNFERRNRHDAWAGVADTIAGTMLGAYLATNHWPWAAGAFTTLIIAMIIYSTAPGPDDPT